MWPVSILSYVMIIWGMLWLLLELWIWKVRSRVRHRVTGAPIPAVPFFRLLRNLVKNRFVPGSTNPIVGALESKERYGDTYIVWRGWYPIIFTSRLEDAKNLLAEKGDFYKPDFLGNNPTIAKLFGRSLVAVGGDAWKQQRKAMDPAFKYKKLKTLVPLFSQAADKLLGNWDKICDKGPVKVEEGITDLTLDVIGLAGFSYSFGALDKAEDGTSKADSALSNYEMVMGSMFRPLNLIFPVLAKLPSEYNRKLNAAFAQMDELLYNIINKHRENKEEKNRVEEADLLDHILELDRSGQLTNNEIRDNLFLFFVAGHDTSSSVLTSALYYLSSMPDLQERAYQEVNKILGDRPITFDDIPNLELVSNIIKETLRMRPPVGGTSVRKTAREGVTIGDYNIPVDHAVSPSIFTINYDEKLWPNPHTFNPDRFKGKKNPFTALLTFSTGPHVCIGRKFAMMEMTITLAMMIRKFQFTLLPNYQLKCKPFTITLKPLDGLPLIVTRRPAEQ